MPRASRHYIPGFIWHITHRCHKREFLLRFRKDRYRLTRWLYQAKKRYGITILNYMVTSNHIHLLVKDTGVKDSLSRTIQLIAGRTAQEYNNRKHRKGAFWEDRYHAVAVESGEHLIRCLVYIDLNMVRAGAVRHPSEWEFSGYNEIQRPRRKYVLISYEDLMNLAGYPHYDSFRKAHRGLVEAEVERSGGGHQAHWTQSIAVGSRAFVETVQQKLFFRALGRRKRPLVEGMELREPVVSYNPLFEAENADIETKNRYF
ncbi:MAG: transposase [Desulfobacterales bacterium]|nr:transposase [Desulfobacterales bacterium]